MVLDIIVYLHIDCSIWTNEYSPKEHRSITVREAAAITGFPNDYKFVGSHTQRCEEVGNAVPPALSTAIAKSVKGLLDSYYNK